MAKTGGLADVASALPTALAKGGVQMRLMMPAYPSALRAIPDAVTDRHFDDLAGFGAVDLLLGRAPGAGLPIWLVHCPRLYEREGGPYQDTRGVAWDDNLERFALLCQAATRVAADPGQWRPDLIHANDWHTSLIPTLLAPFAPGPAATLLTIHNAAFQGQATAAQLQSFGVPAAKLDAALDGELSFLALGICDAGALTTVSPTYAVELQTAQFGCGLECLLRARSSELYGILNGVNYAIWDPARDPLIAHPYQAENLRGKSLCKSALLEEMRILADERSPLLAVVSRLTWQKGLDLLLESANELLALGGRLVVLGQGEKKLEEGFRELALHHPERVAVRVAYDEALAHRIIAGADIFLMPSRFEPCGLNQLYSLRYATVPIVHAVGGLADSVIDAGNEDPRATGFVFRAPTAPAFTAALTSAMALCSDRSAWSALQRNGMQQDFSWDHAAKMYRALYDRLTRV